MIEDGELDVKRFVDEFYKKYGKMMSAFANETDLNKEKIMADLRDFGSCKTDSSGKWMPLYDGDSGECPFCKAQKD